LLPISEARRRRLCIETHIDKPKMTGIKSFRQYPLSEIREFIDWSPFFTAWEMKGRYPQILDDVRTGEEARKLFDDAERLLDEIVKKHLLKANAVIGIFPANSVGDDIEILNERGQPQTVFHMLRQQAAKSNNRPNLCLSDFVAPKDSGQTDYVGVFAVTTGVGLEDLVKRFEADHDDYHAIMAKALADRLAEAFAELVHARVRREFWGYAVEENLNKDELIAEKYRGIRPAPGYPACPDHSEKQILFDLLNVPENAGIKLTENYAMLPAASVSGFYFAHPQAQYFGIGKIGRDQLADYARRKGVDIKTAQGWLASNV